MKKIEMIDFLKGYSIFTIVIFHYLQTLQLHDPYNKFIFFGGTGVHLFILISGIGLYLSYLNKPLNYISFLRKRFSKVYIPYILVVLMTVLIFSMLSIEKISIYAVFGHVFLYKMFDNDIIGTYGYHLWFISMIFQFYFVFYVIIYFKKRANNIVFLTSCFAISLAWALIVAGLGKETFRSWNSFFLQYLWEFALGMMIATLLNDKYEIKQKINSNYILLAGLTGCAIYGSMALLFGNVGKLFNDVPALIGYSCIGIWFYLLNISVIRKFFLFTGKVSYSFYLLHILIYELVNYFLKAIPVSWILIISLLLSYLSAFYYQKIVNHIYRFLKI
jgi:peptidoglycan/LPS O-acetylase OafA/YrhL